MSVTVQSRRNRTRSITAAVLTVLLLVPFGFLFARAWDTTTDDRAATIREQQGVQYLSRLAPLVTALADAQTAALAGVRTPPAALEGAVAAVSEVDGRLGATLRTSQRWADLRARIGNLAGATGTSLDLYRAHAEVGDLLLALFGAVRDNSLLVSDPDNDVAHLQQAVGVDLPETVVQASRMADLSLLVENTPAAQRQQLNLEFPAAVASVDFAVRRLTEDLQAAAEQTGSRTLSGDLISTLDNVRRSVETLTRGAATGGKPDAATLTTGRDQLKQTMAALNGTIVKEMDGLLGSRLDDIDADRRELLLTAGAAAVLALLALAVALVGRRRGPPSAGDDPAPGPSALGDWPASISHNGQAPRFGDDVSPTGRERSGAVR